MPQGNGQVKTSVFEEIAKGLAQMTASSYTPPDREPKRGDTVIGVCSPHIMALYSLGNQLNESTRPAAEDINAIQRELEDKIGTISDIPSLIDAVTDDLRAKVRRVKELETALKPAMKKVDSINELLAAEIVHLFPETIGKKIAIDSSWQVVIPGKSRHDEDAMSELAAMIGGHLGHGRDRGSATRRHGH